MKARIGLTLAIIFALASLTAVVPKALAGEGCSVKRLEGTFGYAGQAFILSCLEYETCSYETIGPPPSAIGSYAPVSLGGTISFDGEGNVTGVDFINLGYTGGIPRTYAGTYSAVETPAGCAFTTTFTDTLGLTHSLYMVLARDGKVLELVNTKPGVILAFAAEKK